MQLKVRCRSQKAAVLMLCLLLVAGGCAGGDRGHSARSHFDYLGIPAYSNRNYMLFEELKNSRYTEMSVADFCARYDSCVSESPSFADFANTVGNGYADADPFHRTLRYTRVDSQFYAYGPSVWYDCDYQIAQGLYRTFGDFDGSDPGAVRASLHFYLSVTIPDREAITVGQRDAALNGFLDGWQGLLDDYGREAWLDPNFSLQVEQHLSSLAAEHSTDDILLALHTYNLFAESYADWQQSLADAAQPGGEEPGHGLSEVQYYEGLAEAWSLVDEVRGSGYAGMTLTAFAAYYDELCGRKAYFSDLVNSLGEQVSENPADIDPLYLALFVTACDRADSETGERGGIDLHAYHQIGYPNLNQPGSVGATVFYTLHLDIADRDTLTVAERDRVVANFIRGADAAIGSIDAADWPSLGRDLPMGELFEKLAAQHTTAAVALSTDSVVSFVDTPGNNGWYTHGPV